MNYRIFEPATIGRFTILPAGTSLSEQSSLPIRLGNRGAFGSGEHETTQACLELLQLIPSLQGAHALDLGSGTGILAIAAARLGTTFVTAIDSDKAAAKSSAENALLNGLADRIHTVQGELSCIRTSSISIVMANIYADILLGLADQLVALTEQGGYLLLSGIPLQDKFDVWNSYTARGAIQLDSRIGEEYATYLFRKEHSSLKR